MSENSIERFETEVAAMPDPAEGENNSPEALGTPKSDLEKAGEVFGLVEGFGGDIDATMAQLVRDANEYSDEHFESQKVPGNSEAHDEAKIADIAGAYKVLQGGDVDNTARALANGKPRTLIAALQEIGSADPSGEAVKEITGVIDMVDPREAGHDSVFGAGVNPESGNYDARLMPRSEDSARNAIDDKVDKGEPLNIYEAMNGGRDEVQTQLGGVELMPDHAYRATDTQELEAILAAGYVEGRDENDEYKENEEGENNNKGVDWYLGGASPHYGDIVLESPARPDYFEPAIDNGTHMAKGSTARHMKSSGGRHPVPKEFVTVIARDETGSYLRMPISDYRRK